MKWRYNAKNEIELSIFGGDMTFVWRSSLLALCSLHMCSSRS